MKSFPISCLAVLLFVAINIAAPPETSGQQAATPTKVFRLVFNAYNGDQKKDPYEKFSFQIKTIDLRQPSEFRKLGERIPNTKLKLSKFEYKVRRAADGEEKDVSELTIVNVDTGEATVLVLGKVTNIPSAAKP